MATPVKDLNQLLSGMEATLEPGVWAFVSVSLDTSLEGIDVLATFKEKEGLTLVVPEGVAISRNWNVAFRSLLQFELMCRIFHQKYLQL